MNAEVFSQPIGFVPQFPSPPKYIKVKAQNRTQKDFDRVFLAQVLLGGSLTTRKKSSNAKPIDAEIMPIGSRPSADPGPSASRAIWAMEFSRDGRYFAAAGQDKKVRVWLVISNAEERKEHERDENAKNVDDDGLRLNAPVFKTKLVREYEGHTASVLDLSWSKNNFLLSSSMDKTVRLYHVSRDDCLCAFKHNDFVTSIQFHPRDDRFFLAGSLDSKLRLWSIPDKTVAFWAQIPDMVTAVAFTPDGKTAIAGCLNGLCLLYDTEGLKAHSQIHVRSARRRNAKGCKITGIDTIVLPKDDPNGHVKLLITSNDSRVRMYNLKDRSLEIKFRGNENTCSQIHASFSDDGRYVICGSEDKKVYIWPTGPVEKQDPEKRPVEIFEAHSAIVTTAILAPTKARQHLAQSGDPLFDLCNPPPITLLSKNESVVSSRAPTDSGASAKEYNIAALRKNDSARKAPETPAYLARQAHPDGNIIVTADYTGQIKIFRQDCAHQKRRQESWDSSSIFSKKILGRSGSVATRTSMSSSLNNRRTSLNLGNSKNASADRILNWRNSISHGDGNANSMSDVNFDHQHRPRSVSPQKSPPIHKNALRRGSFLAHRQSSTSANSPLPSLHKSSGESPRGSPSASQTPDLHNIPLLSTPESMKSPSDETSYHPVPHSSDDPLYLQGDQSFMYWNVRNTVLPMASQPPRTPGLLNPGDPFSSGPLSRKNSAVSQLSSEQVSSLGNTDDESGDREEPIRVRDNSVKCRKCSGEEFRATIGAEGQRLRCKRCGTVV